MGLRTLNPPLSIDMQRNNKEREKSILTSMKRQRFLLFVIHKDLHVSTFKEGVCECVCVCVLILNVIQEFW